MRMQRFEVGANDPKVNDCGLLVQLGIKESGCVLDELDFGSVTFTVALFTVRRALVWLYHGHCASTYSSSTDYGYDYDGATCLCEHQPDAELLLGEGRLRLLGARG